MPPGEAAGVFVEEGDYAEDEVCEVDGVGVAQHGYIVGDQCSVVDVGLLVGGPEAAGFQLFEEDVAGFSGWAGFVFREAGIADGLPDGVADAVPLAGDVDLVTGGEAAAELCCVFFVVDDEVCGEAECAGFHAEDVGAEGVEGGALNVAADAALDFAGGTVGEAEAEHALWCDATGDGHGGALGESHCFARADRCHDEDWRLPLVDYTGLKFVEQHVLMISRQG